MSQRAADQNIKNSESPISGRLAVGGSKGSTVMRARSRQSCENVEGLPNPHGLKSDFPWPCHELLPLFPLSCAVAVAARGNWSLSPSLRSFFFSSGSVLVVAHARVQ